MPRPYNKKTRETAAVICAVLCQYTERQRGWLVVLADFGLRASDTAARLAMAASDAVFDLLPDAPTNDVWAEAEMLIREGWRIGEPVPVLKLPVEEETIPSPFNEARTDAANDSIPVEPEDDEEEPRPDPVADAIEAGDAETADEAMTSTYEDDTPEEPTIENDPSLTVDQPDFEYGGEG